MASTDGSYEIRAEPRGAHWIAWIARGGSPKPDRSVVLVAATEAEARKRAQAWAQQNDSSPRT